jgi:gluconate 2-dehydrogenase gamma chain
MNPIIDRREAIKRTAMLMGAAVSASAITGVLNGCKPAPELLYTPVFFAPDQARIVTEVCEIIIPKTDTPGAKEAGVPGFIDTMLKDCYKKEDQDRYIEGLTAFDERAKSTFGDRFIHCKPEQQTELVKTVHDEALQQMKENREAKRPFMLMTKELTLLGFFTSEPGATQVLQYVAVPGAYKGCIPLSEAGNGKAWA